jgi:hypothetical protein
VNKNATQAIELRDTEIFSHVKYHEKSRYSVNHDTSLANQTVAISRLVVWESDVVFSYATQGWSLTRHGVTVLSLCCLFTY